MARGLKSSQKKALLGSTVVLGLLLSACGSTASDNGSAAPPNPATPAASESTPDQSESSPQAEATVPATPTVETVTGDIIVISKAPEEAVTNLLEMGIRSDSGGECALAIGVVLESAGSTVAIKSPGKDELLERLVPSAINGSDLPCQIEAVFSDVPIPKDGTVFNFVTRGGEGGYLAETATVTGRDLINNGFIVELS